MKKKYSGVITKMENKWLRQMEQISSEMPTLYQRKEPDFEYIVDIHDMIHDLIEENLIHEHETNELQLSC